MSAGAKDGWSESEKPPFEIGMDVSFLDEIEREGGGKPLPALEVS